MALLWHKNGFLDPPDDPQLFPWEFLLDNKLWNLPVETRLPLEIPFEEFVCQTKVRLTPQQLHTLSIRYAQCGRTFRVERDASGKPLTIVIF